MDNQNDERGKTKTCSICKVELPLSDFHKHTKSPDKCQSRCKNCAIKLTTEWQKNFADRTNAKNSKWKSEHPDQVRESRRRYREGHRGELTKYATVYRRSLPMETRQKLNRKVDLKRKYGVTVEWYDAQLIAQDGRCAICSDPVGSGRALAVDHNHTTLRNRGLLCGHCNPLLHKLEADSDWMAKAVQYLNSHGG